LRPALRKYAGSRANNSTHTAPPTFRKRRCSELRLCQIAGKFARIRCAGSPRIPFLPRAHGRDLEADCPCYCGQKNEPRCGIDTRARGSGHCYYRLLRKVLFEENRKIPGRTADWDRRATLANDYWFLPCGAPLTLCARPPPPPLASLFGFRSRTSTCGLSFFSSLILPFLVC